MIRRGAPLFAIGALLSLAAIAPNAFLTAPQGDSGLNALSVAAVDVSADGRSVAFESYGRLVPADTDDRADIYVLDLETKRVTLESAALPGQISTSHPRLSANGQYLVFEATTQLAPGTAPRSEIVLCNRAKGTTTIVSAAPDGRPADNSSRDPDISGDGAVVVFASSATNLVSGDDRNGAGADVYVRDVAAGTLQRVSLDARGEQSPSGVSFAPAVSDDGRWVAFTSSAPLLPGPQRHSRVEEGVKQVYARNLGGGPPVLVSGSSKGVPADRDSWGAAISGDGRFVVFASDASNLAGRGRHRASDVFLKELRTNTVTLISRTQAGAGGSGTSTAPAISADGRFVAFQSNAPDLVCDRRCSPEVVDINLLSDVFLFDRAASTIVRVSQDDDGEWMDASRGPSLDGSGRVLAFASRHPTDAHDVNNDYDLFVTTLEEHRSSRQRTGSDKERATSLH